VVALSAAASRRQRVILRYRSRGGDESERDFDPYGLVYRRTRWYAVGYCHLRSDLRLFRLDRVQEVATREEFFERPAGFDALDTVLRSLGSVPRRWPVEVLLQTTMEEARRWIAPEVAVLEAENDSVVLRCYTDDLPWLARLLASIGCPLTVRRPAELKAAIQEHALMLLGMIQGSEDETGGGGRSRSRVCPVSEKNEP
jgi:predicted DNA-binding transcriptional regulator YafY